MSKSERSRKPMTIAVKTKMGTDAAPLEIPAGAKTSVELALIGPEGPNGRFIHMGQELPW